MRNPKKRKKKKGGLYFFGVFFSLSLSATLFLFR